MEKMPECFDKETISNKLESKRAELKSLENEEQPSTDHIRQEMMSFHKKVVEKIMVQDSVFGDNAEELIKKTECNTLKKILNDIFQTTDLKKRLDDVIGSEKIINDINVAKWPAKVVLNCDLADNMAGVYYPRKKEIKISSISMDPVMIISHMAMEGADDNIKSLTHELTHYYQNLDEAKVDGLVGRGRKMWREINSGMLIVQIKEMHAYISQNRLGSSDKENCLGACMRFIEKYAPIKDKNKEELEQIYHGINALYALGVSTAEISGMTANYMAGGKEAMLEIIKNGKDALGVSDDELNAMIEIEDIESRLILLKTRKITQKIISNYEPNK